MEVHHFDFTDFTFTKHRKQASLIAGTVVLLKGKACRWPLVLASACPRHKADSRQHYQTTPMIFHTCNYLT